MLPKAQERLNFDKKCLARERVLSAHCELHRALCSYHQMVLVCTIYFRLAYFFQGPGAIWKAGWAQRELAKTLVIAFWESSSRRRPEPGTWGSEAHVHCWAVGNWAEWEQSRARESCVAWWGWEDCLIGLSGLEFQSRWKIFAVHASVLFLRINTLVISPVKIIFHMRVDKGLLPVRSTAIFLYVRDSSSLSVVRQWLAVWLAANKTLAQFTVWWGTITNHTEAIRKYGPPLKIHANKEIWASHHDAYYTWTQYWKWHLPGRRRVWCTGPQLGTPSTSTTYLQSNLAMLQKSQEIYTT